MDFFERLSMRGVLWSRLQELHGNSFESFFHDLMALCVPGFVDVRTAGKLGDQSSDGLGLFEHKLYACYAPETVDAKATIRKFQSDLRGAMAKRAGQFTTFVFVHNDVRGVHPETSAALAQARNDHPGITLELMGVRHFRDMLGKQDCQDVEALLQQQLPLQYAVAVGLQEMEELLADLALSRVPEASLPDVEKVSTYKLRYSELTEDSQSELRSGMRFSSMISDYYQQRIDITERDEVAARFHSEYLEAARSGLGPEDILLRIRQFLAGNRVTSAPKYRAQTAVLAYFFESCDIFENAPDGWTPDRQAVTR